MLIGIDASRYGHETATGVERYSFYIINGLLKKVSEQHKHKLLLYSRGTLKLPKDVPTVNTEFKEIKRKKFWTQIGLSKEMKKSPPDRLFVPSHTLPRTFPKESIITIHDVAFKHLKKSYSFTQYLLLDQSTKQACRKAWKIIVPSICTKQDLIHFYKCPEEKIVVIPHGYEPLRDLYMNEQQENEVLEQFHLKPDDKYIFFVGRLETKKNIENLLKAFAGFVTNHPEWKLVLCGKRGIGFKNIFKIAGKLEIWENVLMPGYITDAEKCVLFKHCQFFAFPSLYEGFGFPILEAFSHGKAVLTSRVSSIPEVAGEAVYYTNPDDIQIMTHDIERLANDTDLRKTLEHKASEQLEKFNWDDTIEKTWKILTE
ncbi:MAG: glycosyltransferase family 1 protein [Patescibacteria group bacterium]|nr:glycosyltransferase family 4 protein [Patescibacteria group bacterium]